MSYKLLGQLKIKSRKKGDFGQFTIEPLPSGFGHTLGNALRRVLLSSLPGAAVTQFRIEGVPHQFTTIPGVREDVVDISLNLKKIRLNIYGDNPVTLKIEATGPGKVVAGDLEVVGDGEIVNKDLHLLSLADKKTKISLEVVAEPGVGYSPSEEREISKIGAIPLDSIFTPIKEVAYRVEETRVGKQTNLDRLILEFTTDGTITPSEALKKASLLLVDYFKVISGGKPPAAERKEKEEEEKKGLTDEERKTPIEDLGLSTRTTNALLRGGVKTLGGLVGKDKESLLKIKGLGEGANREIEALLKKQGWR